MTDTLSGESYDNGYAFGEEDGRADERRRIEAIIARRQETCHANTWDILESIKREIKGNDRG
jgi:hypothetical protein